jgi:Flp pilus assembly protein TadG
MRTTSTRKPRGRRKAGQGMLEFALILPLLLLVILAIIDFGWMLLVYSNVFNAAREGVRYGVTNPRDIDGIDTSARQKVSLVPPDDVTVQIWYDTGPGTAVFTDTAEVELGDRVVVNVRYLLTPITPLIRPFMQDGLDINTQAARTIQTLGAVSNPSPGNPPPTETDVPTGVPTDDGTTTGTPSTGTPGTPSGTPGTTLTPPPTPIPIWIYEPLLAGETVVDGEAEPNETVTLRDIQSGLVLQALVDGSGYFVFNLAQPLIGGHTIVVQGYGQQDSEVVLGGTPTPTPSPTPLPTPTPTTPFILLNPDCSTTGERTVRVHGYNWPASGPQLDHTTVYWDWDGLQAPYAVVPAGQTTWVVTLTVPVDRGTYAVMARAEQASGNPSNNPALAETAQYDSPCDVLLPNLQVTGLALQPPIPDGTYEEVWVEVTLSNVDDGDVTSLFWVDLFADPDMAAPLNQQASADWVAVNGLASHSSITFTMYMLEGFQTTGDHTLVVMGDTWEQIVETEEDDNVSDPLVVTISQANPSPTPTPTPSGTPAAPGRIEGTTYVDGVPQSGVDVYLYDLENRLVASTRSATNGFYWLDNLAPGDYVIIGQMRLGDRLYRGQATITVLEGTTIQGANLMLTEV